MREAEGRQHTLLLLRILRPRGPDTRSITPTAAAAQALARRIRAPPRTPIRRRYRARPGKPALRASPRRVVRAGASDQRLCRDLRVWLTPKSGWRKSYADWPALHKAAGGR